MGREGRPGQADSSVLALLGLKGIMSWQGPSWRTATNHALGSTVPSCQVNLGFLATENFQCLIAKVRAVNFGQWRSSQ